MLVVGWCAVFQQSEVVFDNDELHAAFHTFAVHNRQPFPWNEVDRLGCSAVDSQVVTVDVVAVTGVMYGIEPSREPRDVPRSSVEYR